MTEVRIETSAVRTPWWPLLVGALLGLAFMSHMWRNTWDDEAAWKHGREITRCEEALGEKTKDLAARDEQEASVDREKRYCDDAAELMHRRTFMTADGRCYSAIWNRPDLGWELVDLPYFPELEDDR